MNNARFTKETSEPLIIETDANRDIAEAVLGGDSESEINLVKRSLSFLKDNIHFKSFMKRVVDVELKKYYTSLRKEKDPVKMYRLQGEIEGVEKMFDLESKLKNLQDKLIRIYDRDKTRKTKKAD